MARPVFRARDDERTYASPVWSSRSAYEVGEPVIIVTSARTEDWYVKADKDMQAAAWILRLLGAVFLAIGGTILLMMILGVPDYLVQTIGGAMGALSFSIPATFMLPGLWLAHRSRPNFLFGANEPFGSEQWVLGGVFTGLGVIVTLAVVALGRYQLKHKAVGWTWSRSWP